MSNLDQPVSSYLSVNDTSVVLNLDTVYQIEAKSINSDKTITYKSSDETIATVDANGLVTPVGDKEGDVEITVSIAASDYYLAGEQKVKIAVKQPLTFEALEDGQIYVGYWFGLSKPIIITINRTTKKEINPGTTIPVKKGDKVQFESANEYFGNPIQPQTKCAVYGNVMSMISPDGNYHTNKTITQPYALQYLLYNAIYDGTNWVAGPTFSHEKYELMVPATKLTNGCYYSMFAYTKITKAPELPATELSEGCYGYMFNNCSSLEKAPALPATKLANYCYQQMFNGCTLLTEAPKLSATTMKEGCYQGMFARTPITEAPALGATSLAKNCYEDMFWNCYELEKAPDLPAATLKEGAYRRMFAYCYKLKEVKCLATDISANECTLDWLFDVNATGTFTKASSMEAWPAGTSGIPDGWTVK
jgi:hypothetical protein